MQANEIYHNLMNVLQEAFKDKSTTYIDVFGAIEGLKQSFSCEYAVQVGNKWREEQDIRYTDLKPEIENSGEGMRKGY